VIINDYKIFGDLLLVLTKLGIESNILYNVYDEDGPYFALTKAENYVLKFKKGIYSGMDNPRRP
jgi:hypothetical protein